MRGQTIAGPTLVLIAITAVLAGAAPQEEGVIVLGDVTFPHELHYLDLEIDCVTCHHETNAARLDMPHEVYSPDSLTNCKRCHRDAAKPAEIQSCGSCHHDSPADIADETLSAKVVVHRSCWGCHEVGTGVSATRSCGSCHSEKNRTSPARKPNGEQ